MVSLFVILCVLFFEWYSRMVFIACAYCRRYGHGKSWKRASAHYKANWSLLERLFYRPLFKEKYEHKYRMLAYLSIIHLVLAIMTVTSVFLDELLFKNIDFWFYVFIAFSVFTVFVRFIYNNELARGKF